MDPRERSPAPEAPPRPAPGGAPPAPDAQGARIAHVIHSGGFYGAEKVICDLARAQLAQLEGAPDGVAPRLVALLDPGAASNEVADRAEASGIPVIRLNLGRGASPRGLAEYADAVRRSGATLVHSHGYKATFLHLASRWAGRHRLPLLVTAHGYPKGSGSLKATLYRWLDISLLGFADSVVAVSGEMREYLARRNPACRPRLIPNGIPAGLRPRGSHPLLRRLAAEGAEGTLPVIGSAGRLVPMKNHALLIRAYAELRRSRPCRLVILGDGPLRGYLESLWRELVPDEPVRLYPFQDDVLEWMADMDVFCLPSRDGEGLPIALLEAGLLERAAACTASGGIPEVVEDGRNGRLVPLDDAPALVRALADLVADPAERARLGAALRRDVLREHDIGVTHARYLEAYAHVLARS